MDFIEKSKELVDMVKLFTSDLDMALSKYHKDFEKISNWNYGLIERFNYLVTIACVGFIFMLIPENFKREKDIQIIMNNIKIANIIKRLSSCDSFAGSRWIPRTSRRMTVCAIFILLFLSRVASADPLILENITFTSPDPILYQNSDSIIAQNNVILESGSNVSFESKTENFRGAELEIIFSDKPALKHKVLLPKGEPENPATPDDLEEKFKSCIGDSWTGQKTKAVMQAIRDLDQSDDIRMLTKLIRESEDVPT